MFPKMIRIHNHGYNRERIGDVQQAYKESWDSLGLDPGKMKGKKIGIAVGSRGIDQIQAIVRMTVGKVKEAGGEPYIFAAMGSHGGGTAQGQQGHRGAGGGGASRVRRQGKTSARAVRA